jgi:hypothetical protein
MSKIRFKFTYSIRNPGKAMEWIEKARKTGSNPKKASSLLDGKVVAS